jgi:hypothetical protein
VLPPIASSDPGKKSRPPSCSQASPPSSKLREVERFRDPRARKARPPAVGEERHLALRVDELDHRQRVLGAEPGQRLASGPPRVLVVAGVGSVEDREHRPAGALDGVGRKRALAGPEPDQHRPLAVKRV